MKVLVVGNALNYGRWLGTLVDTIAEADVVVFTGGEDVSPELYGQKKHRSTGCNPVRDQYEEAMFTECVQQEKFMLGICRGSQFLTVMAGGELIQDIDHHAIHQEHKIYFDNDEFHWITSTHHQMMNPYVLDESKYDVLAWAAAIAGYYITFRKENEKPMIHSAIIGKGGFRTTKEPEIVHYHNINALCVQGHPENMDAHRGVVKKIKEIIENILKTTLV